MLKARKIVWFLYSWLWGSMGAVRAGSFPVGLVLPTAGYSIDKATPPDLCRPISVLSCCPLSSLRLPPPLSQNHLSVVWPFEDQSGQHTNVDLQHVVCGGRGLYIVQILGYSILQATIWRKGNRPTDTVGHVTAARHASRIFFVSHLSLVVSVLWFFFLNKISCAPSDVCVVGHILFHV